MGVPDLSVVVPTSGKPERLVLALHSLIPQTLCRNRFETIVVADGPAPGTEAAVDVAHAAGQPVRLVRTPALGQAAARNRGAAAARAPALLFMDDDVLLSPDYLKTALTRLAEEPNRVVRAPVYLLRYLAPFRDPERGIRYDGRVLAPGAAMTRRLVSRQAIVEDWPSIARQCVHRNRFERLVSDTLANGPATHRWLGYSGSGVALAKPLFEAAGGYDEGFGFRWGAEAIELGYRLMRRGAEFRGLPGIFSAHMDHPRGASLDSFAASFDHFFDKHRDPAIRAVERLILGEDRRPGSLSASGAMPAVEEV
ncbi:MAG TPA: glycosyltransferase family 2 protein [Aurantimonas coralicida]|uniref:Glycosyltransferase family 2 protein n=2 Tax=root TaxID=1 RepID=A0A9C9TIN3_9HYPH|nr:glycosyltransferase family 2 protein [Aurantimonas coralicida]HEU02043.1 glycosyltransferase family 2 protein [Aurantimonas coralicida]